MRHLAKKPSVLLLTYLVIVSLCLIAFGVYLSEARRLIGANYTAMVTDVVRAQEDPERLRMILDSLLDSADSIHVEQLNDLLWRLPLRIQSIKTKLARSEIPPDQYQPLIEELDTINGRLPALEEATLNVNSDRVLTQAESVDLLNLGMDIEEGLAWSYSELNELLHRASADQRRLMEWLTLALAALLLMLVAAIGVVLLMLYRLNAQREMMRRQSRTDELTGLRNRRRLLEDAGHHFQRRDRHDSPISLLLLDLDHFKLINDDFGHPVGDQVLVAFANLLLECSRQTDSVARMGGEEFAILLPFSDGLAAQQLAQRILAAVREMPMPGPAQGRRLTVSIGVAEAESDDDFDGLYHRADRRLYRAKAQGRDRAIG
ncbi:GGDEF domain-containing protein [Halomonas sp.]|uniref:GGDEF domain-containing protein n=1 Tax=Halomonas sp. TaxID=1486246 RepID=UPI0038507729